MEFVVRNQPVIADYGGDVTMGSIHIEVEYDGFSAYRTSTHSGRRGPALTIHE
jgi:hypothetical protein